MKARIQHSCKSDIEPMLVFHSDSPSPQPVSAHGCRPHPTKLGYLPIPRYTQFGIRSRWIRRPARKDRANYSGGNEAAHPNKGCHHCDPGQCSLSRVFHGTHFLTFCQVGHSLGGALAELDALFMTLNLPSNVHVKAVTYGTPRVGNAAWASFFDSHVSSIPCEMHLSGTSSMIHPCNRSPISYGSITNTISFPSSRAVVWVSPIPMEKSTSSPPTTLSHALEMMMPPTPNAQSTPSQTFSLGISSITWDRIKVSALVPFSATENVYF